jgi:four helix bundle protein
MKYYKKLLVWRKSHELVLMIYEQTKRFPDDERYGITSQIRRATVSVPTNIAEGCGRYSQPDLARFLQIACGSIHELTYLTRLAIDLNYYNGEIGSKIESRSNEVKAMLISLITKIRKESKLNS